MAITALNTIKNWFKTGLIPTQAQFWDTWDSFRHKYEKIPVAEIDGIDSLIDNKTDNAEFEYHLSDPNAHNDLLQGKEDKSNKNKAGGYVGLDGISKISTAFLSMVNDLVNGGDNPLTAEQGKILKGLIDDHTVDTEAHPELVKKTRIIPYGEVLTFKTNPEGNPKIKEPDDICIGYVQGVFICGVYLGEGMYDNKTELKL